MTGQKLIDAIKKYNLENLEIESGYFDCSGGNQYIDFKFNDLELPYPEYRDYRYDEPAHIHTTIELAFCDDDSVKCEDIVLDTRKKY